MEALIKSTGISTFISYILIWMRIIFMFKLPVIWARPVSRRIRGDCEWTVLPHVTSERMCHSDTFVCMYIVKYFYCTCFVVSTCVIIVCILLFQRSILIFACHCTRLLRICISICVLTKCCIYTYALQMWLTAYMHTYICTYIYGK